MRNMAKAQGLPLSFIVIAAISVLILVLIVAFTVGGLGSSFKQLTITGQQGDLGTVQSACTANCNKLQAVSPTATQFQSSDYCRTTYAIDLNKNSKIESNLGETNLNCWNQSIGGDCTAALANGVAVTGSHDCKLVGLSCTIEQNGICNATCTTGTALTRLDCKSGQLCCASA